MYVDSTNRQIVLFDNDTVQVTLGCDFTTWMVGLRRVKQLWNKGPDYYLYWEMRLGPIRLDMTYDHKEREDGD